jgi:hypothetical protein
VLIQLTFAIEIGCSKTIGYSQLNGRINCVERDWMFAIDQDLEKRSAMRFVTGQIKFDSIPRFQRDVRKLERVRPQWPYPE